MTGVLVVSHRTPSTAEQCRAYADAGASIFEVDVQMHGDEVVVSHYLPLLLQTRIIERDNWRIRIGRRRRVDPTLASVADIVPADAQLLLDLKEEQPPKRAALVRALAAGVIDPSRCIASSPIAEDLESLRDCGFRTWQTIKDRANLAHLLMNGPLFAQATSVRHTLLDRASVRRLLAIAPGVVAWTVNEAPRAHYLAELGVTGITTDSTEVMTSLVSR